MRSVGIKVIAREAGVHPSTVSLALRNSPKLPDATRHRIQQIARRCNYRPNVMARGLKGQRTRTVGIIAPVLRDLYGIEIMSTQEQWLRERGYASLLRVTHCDPAQEHVAIDDFLARGADGLVFNYIPRSAPARRRLAGLIEAGTEVSVLGYDGFPGADSVCVDVAAACAALVHHLHELDHRRIAIVSRSEQIDMRVAGYRQALKACGLVFDPQLVFQDDAVFRDVRLLHHRLMALKDRPTAVIAYNDELASELIPELIDAGFSVPDDVSVTGFNDTWYCPRLRVPLTTVRLPMAQMGQALVQQLVERIEAEEIEPRRTMFEGELVVRQSTARARRLV